MKKKKVFNFLFPFALFFVLSSIAMADDSSKAFTAIFQNAKSANGDAVIATVVDALYYGLVTIFRGVSTKITGVAGGFMVMLLALDSVKTILTSLNQMDFAAIMKKLMPNLIKGCMTLAFLVAPMKYSSPIPGTNMSNPINNGTMFTWFVEKLFGAFYKLGLYFFGNDPRITNLTVGQMADVFFSTPLNLLQASFNTWTLFAVFTNILKILAIIFCVWMASKILSTLIANTFSALMICVFSVFFLQFMLFDATKSLSQRGVNTVIAQTVTIFMTVGMVGLSYQVMKLVSTDNSVAGIITLSVLLMMMQQCTENVNSMANAMVNGSGLGNSNSSGFMGMITSLGSIVGGGLLLATESAENAIGDFKEGMKDSTAQGLGGKALDGLKVAAKNSVAGQAGAGVKSAIAGKFSQAKAIKDMMGKGQDLVTATKNARLLGEAQKAFKNKQKALRELEKSRHGIGKGSIAAIGANVMISALSGNLHDTKLLASIGERIMGNKNISDMEVKSARQEMLSAAANLKILENSNKIEVLGEHNNIDFKNKEQFKDDKDMQKFMDAQNERIEKAARGELTPEQIQEQLNKTRADSKETVQTEAGNKIREGFTGVVNTFKDDINFGVVSGKGGQDELEKATSSSKGTGSVSANKPDSSGPNNRSELPRGNKEQVPSNETLTPDKITISNTETKGTEIQEKEGPHIEKTSISGSNSFFNVGEIRTQDMSSGKAGTTSVGNGSFFTTTSGATTATSERRGNIYSSEATNLKNEEKNAENNYKNKNNLTIANNDQNNKK